MTDDERAKLIDETFARLRAIKLELNAGYVVDVHAELKRFEKLAKERTDLKNNLNALYGKMI